jgi:hypothetical protein
LNLLASLPRCCRALPRLLLGLLLRRLLLLQRLQGLRLRRRLQGLLLLLRRLQ